MESHRSSSHEQKIPEMSLEHMERAMQAPGFIARRFGEPCLKILYGLVRGHHSDQTLLSGGKSLEVRKFFRRGQNLADNTKRAKPLIQKCFRVISKKRRVGLRQPIHGLYKMHVCLGNRCWRCSAILDMLINKIVLIKQSIKGV